MVFLTEKILLFSLTLIIIIGVFFVPGVAEEIGDEINKYYVTNNTNYYNLSEGENVTFANVTADFYFGDGSYLTGISGGGNPFDQWVNKSSNISLNNKNQTFVNYYLAHDIDITGQGNDYQLYYGCAYENDPTLAFLCEPPISSYGVAQKVNITGHSNKINFGVYGTATKVTEITGDFNYLGGTNTRDKTELSGNGNILAGDGNFNVSGNNNLGVGGGHIIEGDNNLASGLYHTLSADYCTTGGAQNNCGADYGVQLGFDCNTWGSTDVCLGRNSDVYGLYSGGLMADSNVSGQKSYGIGSGFDCIGDNLVCAGSGGLDFKINSSHLSFINKSIILINDSRVLKRLQIVVSSFRGAGSSATEVTYGLNGAWSFNAATTNSVAEAQAVPLDTDRSVAPQFTIGWASSSTTGNVVWKLEVLYRAVDEDWSSTTPDANVYATVSPSATSNGLVLTSFDLPQLSSDDAGMIFRLSRLGGNVSDTTTSVALLVGGAVDYTADKLGASI